GEITHEEGIGRDVEGRLAVLGPTGVLDGASGQVGQQLMSVADAERGDAEFEDGRVHPVGVLGVDGGGSAGEDQADRAATTHLLCGYVTADDLGVDVGLPHPASDQLGVLGPEVDDENGVGLGDRHPIPTRWLRCSALPSVCNDGAIITSAFWNSFRSEYPVV